MNCPNCGHAASEHLLDGCFEHFSNRIFERRCKCRLTEGEALAAAQRAAAIAHLKALGRQGIEIKNKFGFFGMIERIEIINTIAAYRAVGILKGPKP